MLFLRWIDFGGWSVESVLNVAIVQVLPVSKFNFQLGEGGGMCEWVSDGVKSEVRLTIGNIITWETLTAPHAAEATP